jgi:hypothetical protein
VQEQTGIEPADVCLIKLIYYLRWGEARFKHSLPRCNLTSLVFPLRLVSDLAWRTTICPGISFFRSEDVVERTLYIDAESK